MRTLVFFVVVTLCFCLPAVADGLAMEAGFLTPRPARDPWRIDWRSVDTTTRSARGLDISNALTQQSPSPLAPQQPLHAAAVQHSKAYETRAKIHKYASYATLPLFAGELALGQSLFNSSTSGGGNKGVHSAVGAGIIGLFGVNTVTGTWNLFGEGWQEQDGRTLRLVHGLLMMAANGGFVATWALAPHGDNSRISSTFDHDKRIHRDMAVASIGVGTAGYLVMLLANHSPFARATSNTSFQPADTSPAQIGGTSPAPAAGSAPSGTTFPMPQHTGLSTLLRDTVLDYATFPRRESSWWIVGIGGALAAALHPFDDDVNAHLVSSGAADKIWKAGNIVGGPVMYIAPPAVYLYGRYILPRFDDDASTTNKWSHMGLDLVRAELLEEGLVQAIKLSVNRTRPNGQPYSFPSGHAAATFAFASVIERHLGARLALPTILSDICGHVATA